MKTNQIFLKRETNFKLLNAFPLNALKKDYCWGVAIKEISLKNAIKILKKVKFSSYLRHTPLVDLISKKTGKKIKPIFNEARFEKDDIFICFVLKNRTRISGQDTEVNEKNIRVFIISKPFNDLETELIELDKIISL